MEIYHDVESQSFDVIGETPKTDTKDKDTKTFMTEIYEDIDDTPKLDEELPSEQISAPNNTPATTSPDSYSIKKNQIESYIQTLKTNKIYSPTQIRREITALNRHLEKLLQAEKNKINYEDFKNHIIASYKMNNNVHASLKNMYT